MVRRPTAYERGQHDLICRALKLPTDPKAPGLTAYEGVCVVIQKLEVAREAILKALKTYGDNIELKRAAKFLRQPAERFGIIHCYGTESSNDKAQR